MSPDVGPSLFCTWYRAQLHAIARARHTGLRYRVERGPDWCGHPRWMAKPLSSPVLATPPLVADRGRQVTAREVKVWAVSAGLLEAVRPGRVSRDLVARYLDSHGATS